MVHLIITDPKRRRLSLNRCGPELDSTHLNRGSDSDPIPSEGHQYNIQVGGTGSHNEVHDMDLSNNDLVVMQQVQVMGSGVRAHHEQ